MRKAGSRELSERARRVWAKSEVDNFQDRTLVGWLPLYQHLDDTAGIAAHLWDEWAPSSLKRSLAKSFGSETSARQLLVWLAGLHDIGKASPAFAVQVEDLAQKMVDVGLEIDHRVGESGERRQVRHELVSFLTIRDWLMSTHRFPPRQAEQIASVAAAHHGRPASFPLIGAAEARPHLVGAGAWGEVREEFLARADLIHTDPASFDAWRSAEILQPALVVLSGLVIVADWVASSSLFDPARLDREPDDVTAVRVANAWQELDFPGPWRPRAEIADVAELLITRFELPDGSAPRPAQTAFVEAALTVERPELMILEAEMGSGKTEAALLAAEILAGRFGMSGVFVGLPTQATADGMFARVLTWMEHLELETPSNIYLARARAELNPEYEKHAREAYFRSIGEDAGRIDADGAMVIAHNWFSNLRRGPLSNFVVGTIDQALFAGLRSRYLMLRHLAFAGKVVVIDEAHAYDEYMGTFLVRVLEWFGAYGVPVILLSATLPSGLRSEFLRAYDQGRDALHSAPAPDLPAWAVRLAGAESQDPDARYGNLAGEIGYPVVTVSSADGSPLTKVLPASSESRPVRIQRHDDDLPELVRMLREALRNGGNVAVIRNTVRRAQETAAVLRAEFPDVDVLVANSRFLGVDRAAKDRELLHLYGPRGTRPDSSIVVATQVIEQSLDVDFDLMVSDIAPIDLLIQRVGRLHRHVRGARPAPLREPRLVITGANWGASPPEFDGGGQHIYGHALLLRTAAVLENMDALMVPDDIASLVETVYGESAEYVPGPWRGALQEADRQALRKRRERKSAASTYTLGAVRGGEASLIGWLDGPDVDPELTPPGRRTVRDGDESLEVIVLQQDGDGVLRTPSWLQEKHRGIQIPTNERPSPWLTRVILGCFLRLPVGMCRGDALDRHIKTLERAFEFPSWHGSHALKGELVLVFDGDCRAQLNEFDLTYSTDDGLRYERRTV